MCIYTEIVELVELLQPTEEEVINRRHAVEALSDAVKTIFPSAEVKVFGSFSTGERTHTCGHEDTAHRH